MHRRFAFGMLLLVLLAGAASLLSACNTVHGAGQDLEQGSDAVKNKL